MRRSSLAWAVLAILTICAIYGVVHERLLNQELWSEDGVVRLLYFGAVFWIFAGLIIWYQPAWLGPLVAAFVLIYSVWWCWRFFDPAAPMAVIYFLGSSFLLGRLIAPQTDQFTALLLGVAIWIFTISVVVRFPVNTRLTYAAAFAIPYALAWFRRRELSWPEFEKPSDRRSAKGAARTAKQIGNRFAPHSVLRVNDKGDAAAFAVLLFVLLMQWLVALKPEISSDGLGMHLAIPMAVAHDGRWTFDFDRYTWALTPMGGDWAYTAVYLLGGEAAARLLDFSFLVVICAMIYRTSRTWLQPASAYLAVALFASTPLVQLVTGSLFVENIWAAMILGAGLALWRGELIWAGILMGAALSTKVGTTAYLVPAVIMAVKKGTDANFASFGNARAETSVCPFFPWRTAAIATALFVAFAAPPYLNAWHKTRNPTYPFLNNVFKSPYFDTSATAVQDVRYRKVFSWKTPYDATFHSSEYFEGQNGSLGFQYFLLLVPLLLLLKRDAPWTLLALGAGGALLTFATLPNLRYLYPALPLLSIGFAWLISQVPATAVCIVLIIAANVWFLPASSWYHKDFALFRRSQMEDYIEASRPEKKLIEYLNRTAPGEPVAFLGQRPIAGLYARAYVDEWRTFDFWRRLARARSVEDIVATFHQLGIRHLIAPVPLQTNYPNVRYFVEQWTVPTGITSGRDVLYDVIPAPSMPPHQRTSAAPGVYDDLDPEIEYKGAWLQDRQFKGPSSGSITYSNQAGDALRLVFSGSAITYVYTKALNRGFAEVIIDGRERAELNLYSGQTQWQSHTAFGNLGAGSHTIEVQVLGKKDARSTDAWVDLDAFIVSQ